MRVRYGKPIKVTNLLGKQDVATVKSQGVFYRVSNNGNWLPNWTETDNNKITQLNTAHTYIAIIQSSDNSNSELRGGYFCYQPSSYEWARVTVSNLYESGEFLVMKFTTTYTSGRFGFMGAVGTNIYREIILDLTEIDLDNLTAQEFYNKYNKYFSLIATGEEITIDDKAGQIQTVESSLDDYIELEYIESSGEQYISTGVSASIDIGTDIVFKNTVNYMGGIIGEDNTYAWNRYGLFRNGGQLYPMVCNYYSVAVFSSNDPWYHVDFKYPKLTVNDTTYDLPTGSCGTGTIELFRMTSSYYSKIRISSCKLYTSERVLRNFIPAIRKSDNEIGMLDKVNNVFYTNQGTGTFIAGPAKELPSEYQEVEYIESTGTQYMAQWTIGEAYTGNLTVGYKFNVTEHTSDMYFSTITSNQSAGQAYSLGYTTANSPLYIRWNQVQSSATQVDYTIPEIKEVTRTNAISNITLNNVSLFCHNTSYKPWKGRIYKYWLKIDDEYIFDFIPCYRKSDNEIGLYDRIKRVFYNNVGTGTFLKGNNVNNTLQCKIAGGSSDIYYGYNQLAELPETTGTKWRGYNCTMTAENGVATCVANGSNYPALASQFYNIIYELNHIYMHLAKFKQDTAVTGGAFGINTNGMSTKLSGNSTTVVGEWVDLYFFSRGQGASTYQNTFNIQGSSNAVSGATFYVKDCICIDLTDWFGQGKEPSTLTEFREKFTKEYYGFCPTPIKLTKYQIEALPNYGYNQIANINRSTATTRGISFVKNDNNTLTITGTSQQSDNISIGNMEIIEGHKYYGFTNVISGSLSTSTYWIKWVTANYGKDIGEGILFTATSSVNPAYCSFYVEGANININTKVQMMLIDLTDWYGAGSEPTTVEEFKQTFPNLYYPYSKKRLLNKYMINKLIN